MKNSLKAGMLVALALGLLLAAGCGDEDPAGPTEKQIGDLNNPEYLNLMAAMDDSEEYTGMMMEDIFGVMGLVFAGGLGGVSGDRERPITVNGVEADSVYLVYHATSQYWYWYLQSEVPMDTDTLTTTLIDSVQFLHADGPVQWPDSTLLTGVNTGALLLMESGLGSAIEAAHLLTFSGNIVDQGDVTINGTQSIDMLFVGDSCTVTLDMSIVASDIAMNIDHVENYDGCPESGVLNHQGTAGIVCTSGGGLNFSDSWTIVQTFTGDDTYSVVVENSTTRWSFTDTCGY